MNTDILWTDESFSSRGLLDDVPAASSSFATRFNDAFIPALFFGHDVLICPGCPHLKQVMSDVVQSLAKCPDFLHEKQIFSL